MLSCCGLHADQLQCSSPTHACIPTCICVTGAHLLPLLVPAPFHIHSSDMPIMYLASGPLASTQSQANSIAANQSARGGSQRRVQIQLASRRARGRASLLVRGPARAQAGCLSQSSVHVHQWRRIERLNDGPTRTGSLMLKSDRIRSNSFQLSERWMLI